LKDEVLLDQDIVDNYELETSDKWDKFYMKNQQSFFKNRTYLGREFPELSGPNSFEVIDNKDCYHWDRDTLIPTVCEIGCGVGNSIVPLMELNTDKYFIGFDCSSTAVEIFQKREFNKEKCHLFVLDPTLENMNTQIPDNSIDIAILIFVLSAIAPKHMPNVLQQIYASLKPGGILLLRDYGQYDMTHLRFFAKKNPNKMAENYYRREDGTFAYFFEKEATNELFSAAGFTCENTCYDTRVLYNRKRMLKMYRVWIRGRFRKPIQ
jgi:SAM-dependent methyltransferase